MTIYWVTQKLLQIYTANHATFPIRIRKITVQICGNFWVTQYGVVLHPDRNPGSAGKLHGPGSDTLVMIDRYRVKQKKRD